MIGLTGKVVLITGGSRGIGAACAHLFAQAGARVAITYHARKIDAEAVLRAIEKLEGRGKREEGKAKPPAAIALQADLLESLANQRIVEETARTFGRLDFFVANAGIWPAEAIALPDMAEDHWRRTIVTNLDSVFYGCRAA